ncbi:MAG: DUF411 domain-containing protein [Acidobacteria bacterium]|nr:DUF411 domain-containing protein [Acidobacteriota bacterium]
MIKQEGWKRLAGCGALVVLLVTAWVLPAAQRRTQEITGVTVYKSPTCGCCKKWVEHLEANGFSVTVQDVVDMTPIRIRHGVARQFSSCHTALVGGYVVEGHVPADLIRRLLKERPNVAGIAVPGMPMGSPGMEGPHSDPYEVLLFDRAGNARVYARR